MSYGLGRRPSQPDARNWTIRGADLRLTVPRTVPDPALDAALAAFLRKRYSREAKALAALLVQRIEALAPVTPAPPVPITPGPGAGGWELGPPGVLDQGETPHCVGFTGADYENLAPVEDGVPNEDGHRLYYECKVLDGEPKAEDGSSIHSLAKALKARGRIAAYAWLRDLLAVKTWVRTKGPVPIGVDWYDGMFSPDERGLVKPTGSLAGGHAVTIVGDDAANDTAVLLNHWGAGWGPLGGYFRMTWSDLSMLLFNSNGEALATLELPATGYPPNDGRVPEG